MIKRTISFGIISCLTLLLTACGNHPVKGNGKITSTTRALQPAQAIQADGVFNLQVSPDQQPNLTITADSNLIPYVQTTVNKGILVITTKKNFHLKPSQPIIVAVNLKNLNSVTLDGSVNLNVAKLNNDTFSLTSNGITNATLTGTAKTANIQCNGTGQITANELKTEKLTLNIQGATNAWIDVTKELDIKIQGAAQVTYEGNPPVIRQEVYGGGNVTKGA